MAAEQQRPPVAPHVVYHAFRPQIAVYSSSDVDDIAKGNGLPNLAQLLKPWEGSVERVTLRTATFVSHVVPYFPLLIDDSRDLVHTELDALFLDDLSESITKRVPGWLEKMELIDVNDSSDKDLWKEGTVEELTPWYAYYRKALLDRRPRTEYETFGHPVACILAVSTSSPEPLNAFAELYEASSPEKLFADKPWVDPNILRYYVLVHDLTIGPAEDWSGLLEDIRRAYGLHVNMLILNAEAVQKPDSAYIDASQRPPPKPADFSRHWTDLPTSPTRARFQSGPSTPEASAIVVQAEVNESAIEIGAKLGQEDVKRIKLFLREFVVQSLAPWMERTTTQLNEQLAANRKGIAGRLFSAGRRYFGSRPASPAAGTASNTSFDPIKGYYKHSTQEAQTRRLADFALMIADYRLAAANYEIARKDFLGDKAWRYYASATRMAGMTALLLRRTSDGTSSNTEQYLEQAASVPASGVAQLDSLRAVALYYELYQEQEDWPSASDSLAKFASDIDELPSALMLEQAAMAMLRQSSPARRKFALLMIIAAHRYQKTGPKTLANRCGQQALTLYTKRSSTEWRRMRNHLEKLLGRQAYNEGHAAEALKHFLHVMLVEQEMSDQALEQSQDYMDDLKLTWDRLDGDPAIAQTIEEDNFPHNLIDTKRTRILSRNIHQTVDDADAEAWSSLETHYAAEVAQSTPGASLEMLSSTHAHIVPLGVEIWLRNRLAVPVNLDDLTVEFSPQDAVETVESEEKDVEIPALSTTKVSLSVQAKVLGKLILRTARFRYNGMMRCSADLSRQGSRLNTSKAHMLKPTYEEDTSLHVMVQAHRPVLVITCSEEFPDLLAGEIRDIELSLKNIGSRPLDHVQIVYDCAHYLSFATEELCALQTLPNSLHRHCNIPIRTGSLRPNESLVVKGLVRGFSTASFRARLLFTYGSTDDDLKKRYTARFAQDLNVVPSLTLQSQVHARNAHTVDVVTDLRNDNISESFEIVEFTTLTSVWRAEDATQSLPRRLGPKQRSRFRLTLQATGEVDQAHSGLELAMAHIHDLTSGRETQTRSHEEIPMQWLASTQTCPIPNLAHLLQARTVLRLESLQQQFPSLGEEHIRQIFPLFSPNQCDVIVVWKTSLSKRRGWHSLTNLTLSPNRDYVSALRSAEMDAAASAHNEESRSLSQRLLGNVLASELAALRCPVVIRLKVPQTAAGSSSRVCVFEISNTSAEKVGYTFQLTSRHDRSPRRSQTQWVGHLRDARSLNPGESTIFTARYASGAQLVDIGQWELTVHTDHRSWQVQGPEVFQS